MEKPQIILYSQKSVNYTLFESKWIPYSAKFVVLGNHARGTGAFQIYELASGDVKLIKEVFLKFYFNQTLKNSYLFLFW